MGKRSIIGPWPRPAANDKKFEFLSVGSTVEASSDDDGFNGAWYVGKIVKTNKQNGKFVIEYQSLTCDEKPLRPLRETVDISFIRPVPPPPAADQSYELYDVVEAFHRDGWWKGVVSKVELFEGEERCSAKYTVFYENPAEELTFFSKDLRFHLVWADGKWSQPSKEEIPIIMLQNISKRSEKENSAIKRKGDELSHSKEKYYVRKTRSTRLNFEEEKDNGFGLKDKAEQQNVTSKETEISFSNDDAGEGHVENTNQSPAVTVQSDNLNESLEIVQAVEEPFKKESPIWNNVDSIDVFQSMPQKPHFSPLFKVNEALREGQAIGLFLNFSRLVETTSKMRADEPRNVFENNLEALADLELYGFAVKPVVDRLKKLLFIKTRQEELQNESQDIEAKISKCDADDKRVKEQLRQIYEKISKLKKERAMKVSEKLIKESESDSLRLEANEIEEQISKADLDFENLAAAPW